jgi:hypothetical protein
LNCFLFPELHCRGCHFDNVFTATEYDRCRSPSGGKKHKTIDKTGSGAENSNPEWCCFLEDFHLCSELASALGAVNAERDSPAAAGGF